ncbi:MAG: hypothetical protein A2157_19470 [Deltaproteobacteria bacterium RBG_16_47_11]|nr:MAG: hypothetical protein A2157_19470 [Deltaproteobacteria bacterium RBG_16_47_11]
MDDSWGDVPEFPQVNDLTLEDKPLFDQLFTRFPPVISELTFTNLFIWRRAYQTKISRFRNLLCLLSEQGKNMFFFPPIGEGDVIECFQSLLQYPGGKGAPPKIVRVPEAVVTQIDWKASGMKVELDRSQCDYVYLVQDLIELKGRKYHRKRNHIKQFQEKYSFQYIPLTPERIPQCLQLQTEWCDLRDCEANPGLFNESLAIKEAFTHFEELGLKGGAILINGKVEAFTLGDPLNPETIVIHIEKANPAYEGLYPMINQAFLEHQGSGYTYVNREQDLGEEGLRKAKESYFPHHMVNKYTITLE